MKTTLLFYSTLIFLFISACSQSGNDSLFELLELEEITVDQLQERYENGNLTASRLPALIWIGLKTLTEMVPV